MMFDVCRQTFGFVPLDEFYEEESGSVDGRKSSLPRRKATRCSPLGFDATGSDDWTTMTNKSTNERTSSVSASRRRIAVSLVHHD